MPRPPRIQPVGAISHITSRGNRRQDIVLDETDATRFLELVGTVARRNEWRCHGFCVMPNHYHLVVETPHANLSTGMHVLNGRYARWFNTRYDLDGHLFQARFHAVTVESEWHLLELSRYVVLNPVRAGLCTHPADWRWSSYRASVGSQPAPSFLDVETLLRPFGRERAQAHEAFGRFVADAPLRP